MAAGGTIAIRLNPPTLVVAVPEPRGGFTVKSCVFRGIEPGAHALDLFSFLSDEGFLEGLEALPETRLMAYLTALVEQRAPIAPRKPASHEATSWSDDNDEFGRAGAAAELQVSSGAAEDQFDADDLF